MKRNFLSIGAIPEKVDSMNFDELFRIMVDRMLISFCDTLVNLYPTGDYPISEFQTEDSLGVQIALESDLFTREIFILRKNVNGYEVLVLTEDDCEGAFEYEFPEDDPLVKSISQSICNELNQAFSE